MPTVYYTIPGSATAENDEPTNPSFGPPWVAVAQNVYQQELLGIWQSLDINELHLQVSRSKDREQASQLDNATLDTGKTYAVFLHDLPQLGYTQVDFDLDGVFHHMESGTPWDFDGTDGFGFAQKVVFGAGSHTIDAHVTYGGGTFTISASFDVD